MSGWTKGPWRVDPRHWGDIQAANGELEISASWHEAMIGEVIEIGGRSAPPAHEARANARLIAAAPDLAEALGDAPVLSKYHGLHGFEVERFIADYESWRTRARAALAKARGETP